VETDASRNTLLHPPAPNVSDFPDTTDVPSLPMNRRKYIKINALTEAPQLPSDRHHP